MHEPSAQLCSLLRDGAGGGGIEGAGELRLALRLIHGSVGRGIDDDIRAQGANCLGHPGRVGEITAVIGAVEVQCRHGAQYREATLQLPADLAAFAEEQDVHALASATAADSCAYWVCTQSR
ncbi:hypothetical protein D3C80_1898860 [compost metagenome]